MKIKIYKATYQDADEKPTVHYFAGDDKSDRFWEIESPKADLAPIKARLSPKCDTLFMSFSKGFIEQVCKSFQEVKAG